MPKDKIIGTAYVNIIKDEKGEVKFAYGYELNEKELSLNDIEGDFSSKTLKKVLEVLKYYPYVTDKIKGENKYSAMKRTLVKI